MRTLPVTNQAVTFSNSFRAADAEGEKKPQPAVTAPSRPSEKSGKTGPIVTSALAIAALVTSGIAISRGKGAKEGIKQEVENQSRELVNKAKEELTQAIGRLEGKLELLGDSPESKGFLEEINKLKDELNNKSNWFDGYLADLDTRTKSLSTIMNEALKNKGMIEPNMTEIDGLYLVENTMTDNVIELKPELKDYLETVAGKFMRGEAEFNKLKKGNVVWSRTTEMKWKGSGGQGEIASQQAKNFSEVGVTEYEILDATGVSGTGGLLTINGKTKYKYKGETFEVDPVVSFPMDTYHGNRHSIETVTVYYGKDHTTGQPMLIFDCPEYFHRSKSNMYGNTPGGVNEREREAFTGAAMYELEKIIREYVRDQHGRPMDGLNIIDEKLLLRDIKAPDAVYLHDCSAAPYLLAARLRAPLEAASGELSKEVADAISKKNIVAKLHNMDYKGIGWKYTERSDILNTTLGIYAADIYRHAKTGFAEEGMNEIGKVCTIGGGNDTSYLNWLLSLTNKCENVSLTDALERTANVMVDEPARIGPHKHILGVRLEHGTLTGHGNSWDRSANEVSEANIIKTFGKMINNDKIKILQAELKKLKDQLRESKPEISEQIKFSDINITNYSSVLSNLRKLNNETINTALNKLDKGGITTMRKYVPYTHSDSIETIMNAKRQNKLLFIDQLRTMIKYNKESGEEIFKIKVPKDMDLDSITIDNIDDIFIASFGARLVEQKNIPLLTKALREFHAEFKQKYPNKKLLTVIGGPDDTGEKVFHKMLSENIGNNVSVLEFTPNPIYQSASDFTLRTSIFEPDGDLAESFYKGTPTITTKVGGYKERVSGTNMGILTDRTPAEILAAKPKKVIDEKTKEVIEVDENKYLFENMTQDYKKALFEAADIFFNNKAKYESMVRECMDYNVSWIIKDAEGKIVRDCGLARDLEMLGFDLDSFEGAFALAA